MGDKLIQLHGILSRIETRGESTILMAQSIAYLEEMIQEAQTQENQSDK